MGLRLVTADELLLGCLQTISLYGIAQLGPWTFDLEALGVDWLERPARGARVDYSQAVVDLFDRAARISAASAAGGAIQVDHLLAAFAGEAGGLMGELKRTHGITGAAWRAAVAQLWPGVPVAFAPVAAEGGVAASDYLTPEEAAAALNIHVQTLRAYVRSGKLPALRLAGERAIRIRRQDLETVLEPLVPQG
ncbi:MAG: helix-turn-helix domain-containing protein [Candidatus Solibacter sp.]